MDTYMHKTMVSIVSLEKIEIIRSQEFMPSEVRLKFLKKMIILGPKTAILGPQFCRILVLGPHFWCQGGPDPRSPPGSAPGTDRQRDIHTHTHTRRQYEEITFPHTYAGGNDTIQYLFSEAECMQTQRDCAKLIRCSIKPYLFTTVQAINIIFVR